MPNPEQKKDFIEAFRELPLEEKERITAELWGEAQGSEARAMLHWMEPWESD